MPVEFFYPPAERAASWAYCRPSALVRHLLAHVGGHLTDDAAVIAVQHTLRPASPTGAAEDRSGVAGPTDEGLE